MVNSFAIYVKTNCSCLPILATHSANCYVISNEEREKASKAAQVKESLRSETTEIQREQDCDWESESVYERREKEKEKLEEALEGFLVQLWNYTE